LKAIDVGVESPTTEFELPSLRKFRTLKIFEAASLRYKRGASCAEIASFHAFIFSISLSWNEIQVLLSLLIGILEGLPQCICIYSELKRKTVAKIILLPKRKIEADITTGNYFFACFVSEKHFS